MLRSNWYLICARVAHVRAVVLRLEIVVKVPQRHRLVPDGQGGDAELLDQGPHQLITPAALHQNLFGRIRRGQAALLV